MAARYWVNAGTGNWNSTTNWSATSGGASGASVPGTSDDVTFDVNGNSASNLSSGTVVINSLTVTSGYSSTLTITGILAINGNTSFGSAMTLTGAGSMRIGYVGGVSVTLASNGATIGCGFNIGHSSGAGGVTVTLLDNAVVTGALGIGQNSSTGDIVVNGFDIEAQGNITFPAATTSRVVRGTTTISIKGGNNQALSGTALCRLDININKSGNTLTIGDLPWDSGTFTYVAGTVVHTGTLSMSTSSISSTFNTSGMSWNNITWGGTLTQITLLSTFTIAGNLTISNSNTHTVVGTGYLTDVGGTLTIGSNGSVFNPANDMTVGNLTNSGGTGTICSVTGYNIYVLGNLTINASSIDGLGTIRMTGTGIWSGSGNVAVNLVFDSAGTITVSGSVFFGAAGKTMTYTAGTISTTGSTLTLRASSMNTSTVVWYNLLPATSGQTVTLLSNINISNQFSSTNLNSTWNGAYNIDISGSLNLSAQSTTNVNGTATILMSGTGTISGAHTTGGINTTFVINTIGTITFSGTIRFPTSNTFTHTSGTTVGGSSTVSVIGTFNINSSGLNFNGLAITGTTTFTSTGTFGWTANNLTSTTGTHTYKEGATYTVDTSLSLLGSFTVPIIMKSGLTSSYAYFNLNYGAGQAVGLVDATDIDSSGGQTIFDFQGTLLRTLNWNLLSRPATISYTFFV